MSEVVEDGPVQWIRTVLGEWLERGDWEPEQLIDWLQGYKLPPVGHDDEPFLWLLRGLPVADERYRVEVELARRVSKLLGDEPDVKRPGDRPDQVLYNLFMLCAGLSCPEQLADPVYDVYKRRALKGEWLGIDVRDALQAALIFNQIDNRMQSVWEAMIEGQSDKFLPGNAYEGFEGIVLMPEAAARLGEPALDGIGRAFKAMARHLDREQERRLEFQSLIDKVVNTYPGSPTWEIDLLLQAYKNHWPNWAIETIPGKQARTLLDVLQESPYTTSRGTVGVFNQVMADIELSLKPLHPEVSEKVRKERAKILIEERISLTTAGTE